MSQEEYIYGRRTVLEALRSSPDRMNKLFIAQGAHGESIGEIFVSVDGGSDQQLIVRKTHSDLNRDAVVSVGPPGSGAWTLQMKWRYGGDETTEDGRSFYDWWWAIDNVEVFTAIAEAREASAGDWMLYE